MIWEGWGNRLIYDYEWLCCFWNFGGCKVFFGWWCVFDDFDIFESSLMKVWVYFIDRCVVWGVCLLLWFVWVICWLLCFMIFDLGGWLGGVWLLFCFWFVGCEDFVGVWNFGRVGCLV